MNNLDFQESRIFSKGEVFDAYVHILKLIQSAKNSITLINHYVNEDTLTMLSRNLDKEIAIYTDSVSTQLQLDLNAYNKQYHPITIKTSAVFNDNYLILDKTRVYRLSTNIVALGEEPSTIVFLRDFDENSLLEIIGRKAK